MPTVVTCAIEGPTDIPVVERLLAEFGLELGPIHGQRGKDYLDKNLRGFNEAAKHAPWFILRDLDTDASCATELVSRLLPKPALNMRFRVAVRSMEAWLLADRKMISEFLRVSEMLVPKQPDLLSNPKKTLIQLAAKSGKRAIREDMVPPAGSVAPVGPGYLGRVVEFARTKWRPSKAAENSQSLARCLRALDAISRDG